MIVFRSVLFNYTIEFMCNHHMRSCSHYVILTFPRSCVPLKWIACTMWYTHVNPILVLVYIWLVVWLPFFIFPLILGISSSQLTNSYLFRGVALAHQPDIYRHIDICPLLSIWSSHYGGLTYGLPNKFSRRDGPTGTFVVPLPGWPWLGPQTMAATSMRHPFFFWATIHQKKH